MTPGITTVASPHSLTDTVFRFEQLLNSKGVKIFAVIDQAREAESVGLHLRPTVLMIFGNPKAGTPVMIAAPTAAVDLPLKALIWQDDNGKVWISYDAPAYLQSRHNIPQELLPNIAVIDALVAQAVA
ncbi:MAG: DUF302 domain-containing protein [Acidobacteriia bacterium]|nr:DUF302 domain-containing protein [Terriglobia bacterium]